MRTPSTTTLQSSRSKKGRLSKKWDIIPIPLIPDVKELPEKELRHKLFDRGFCIRFFRQDMQYFYIVASHHVLTTRGVLDYLHDYNQLGPNRSPQKLFLCSQFSLTRQCTNGSSCREVHCVLPVDEAVDANIYGITSNATGAPNMVEICNEAVLRRQYDPNAPYEAASSVNLSSSSGSFLSESDDSSLIKIPENMVLRHSLHSRWTTREMYPTLPPGITFQIALPNTPNPVEDYDSGDLFITKGAKGYYDQKIKNKQCTLSMQHCAHLTKNGLCCIGEDCAFVHVVRQRQRENHLLSVSDDVFCRGESTEYSDSARSCKKKDNLLKETPLSVSDLKCLSQEVRPLVSTVVPMSLNSQPFQQSNTVPTTYFTPSVTSQYGSESVPFFMMPISAVPSIPPPSNLAYQPPNVPSQLIMMQGATPAQHGVSMGALNKPVYVFQQVYVPPAGQK